MYDYMKLTVGCMFRDSEKKLPKFFKQLERLEKQYDMIYFFYENDSKDKTAPLLRKWLKKRTTSAKVVEKTRGEITKRKIGCPKMASRRARSANAIYG